MRFSKEYVMASTHTIGWIGMGRMGYPMAERLLKAGNTVIIWNRTRAKAEPLGQLGGRIAVALSDLAYCDIVFIMVSTGKDLEQVLFGDGGVAAGKGGAPKIIVDCSSISVQESAACRAKLEALGTAFLAAPVSGNGKVVKAGKLSAVASGPQAAFETAKPYMLSFAPRGVSYVGEGELSRICKIAHNVMLGAVIQNLAEITILAQKAGVPRHAFLEFINNGVMGSMFTQYKSNAFVNVDWTTTFTPELLRKDLDLGLEAARKLDVPMPVTAATREALQSHFGAAQLQPDPKGYLEKDFAATIETVALGAGLKLKSENVPVPTGLETGE
jgi:3-hydroxyisobutyrate dehydrogenase